MQPTSNPAQATKDVSRSNVGIDKEGLVVNEVRASGTFGGLVPILWFLKIVKRSQRLELRRDVQSGVRSTSIVLVSVAITSDQIQLFDDLHWLCLALCDSELAMV